MVEMPVKFPFVQHLNPKGKKNHFRELQKYLRYWHNHYLISLQDRHHKTLFYSILSEMDAVCYDPVNSSQNDQCHTHLHTYKTCHAKVIYFI